mmetsp:Transcript_38871/g.77118  ORF Transcript_38871/g.77118 Transcript_38871/m.77118 type:complete len:96 (-) Transcript_38871:287-574(-)
MVFPSSWMKALRALKRPDKQTLSRLSWGVAAVLVAHWIYDSERANPKFFSEAPTLVGTPQAREFDLDELEKWNANIAPKEEHLTWRNEGQVLKKQ